MRLFTSLPPALLAACCCFLHEARAQGPQSFTDPETGILFSQYSAPVAADIPKGGFQLGVAFPAKLDENEYIGHLVGSRPQGQGWVSISHGPMMLDTLILLAWVHGNEVQTSFRYATNYTQPDIYSGALSFSQLAHTINKTHFTVTYRCQGCFSWNYRGKKTTIDMKAESILFGWGQGTRDPSLPSNKNSPIDFHNNGFGVIAAVPSLGANPKYDSYVNVASPPRNMGQPKIIPLDPKLAGDRTSWPVGTKSNQPPPVYTPGQISVVPARPPPPNQTGGVSSGGAPPGGVPPGGAPPGGASPSGAPPGGASPGGAPPPSQNPPPKACEPPQVPKPEDDLGDMPAVPGMPKKPPGALGPAASSNPNSNHDPASPPSQGAKRQVQTSNGNGNGNGNGSIDCLPQISPPPPPLGGVEAPKLPVPTATPTPPPPSPPGGFDNLGLNPKMDGVPKSGEPKKPPKGVVRIECGVLYDVEGRLRYIC